MTEETKTVTSEEEKKKRMKRSIAVVVFGVVLVFLFFKLMSGVESLVMADAVNEDGSPVIELGEDAYSIDSLESIPAAEE
jgi:hypothetical protein